MELANGRERKIALKKELTRIVNVIQHEYKPEKVILFGSLANGNVTACSDIDLLIIKDTKKRPIDRCVEVARLVHPRVGIDVFVYTPSEYDTLLKEKFSLLLRIIREGKILYEKRNAGVAKNRR